MTGMPRCNRQSAEQVGRIANEGAETGEFESLCH
jgi:hypothetical protein